MLLPIRDPAEEFNLAAEIMRMRIKNVDEAVLYLKQALWSYGTNEAKYNYMRKQFKEI